MNEEQQASLLAEGALATHYLFRWLHPDEVEQISRIEEICFRSGEALSSAMIEARAQQVEQSFLVAVSCREHRVVGFVSGIQTDETHFRDAFYADPSLHDPKGKSLMLLGLAVLPEYRGQGIGRTLMALYLKAKQQKSSLDRAVLTCLNESIEMYEKMGFRLGERANSQLGGRSYVEMVHYFGANDHCWIRSLCAKDIPLIVQAERTQGWQASADKYEKRLLDQHEGRAVALVALWEGQPVGYINVYPCSVWGPASWRGYPEIVDFGVLEKYRCRGIGSRLMDEAERIAFERADFVFLGVGLHQGYGSAQRMYVRRGYLPDGKGVYYHDDILAPYTSCCNDDHLVLYMGKRRPAQ